jgi:nucleoid DNA-binding protein
MNKLKEDIMDVICIATNRSRDEIEKIINFKFSSLQEAISNSSYKSVEVGGFGRFLWRDKAYQMAIKKCEEKIAAFQLKVDKGDESYRNKLNNTLEELKALKIAKK